MSKEIVIKKYTNADALKWDKFVMEESLNGTFLQTRKFLQYHPNDRFVDNSILFMNNSNIIAVIPANSLQHSKMFYSHQGSTFGGIIIGEKYCKIKYLDEIFRIFLQYIDDNQYEEVVIKQTGDIFCTRSTELIDYYLFMNGFHSQLELGYYNILSNYSDNVIDNFTASKRRDYRYSLANEFVFKELKSEEEITDFYDVLCDNYKKFEKKPVHTLHELLEFKFDRLKENTKFYGVFYGSELIAGGMVFIINDVFHTQYLAVKQDKTNMFANEFLYTNLIMEAKQNAYDKISFGTSTFEGGKILNRPLAQYKEGFGTKEYVNKTYILKKKGYEITNE